MPLNLGASAVQQRPPDGYLPVQGGPAPYNPAAGGMAAPQTNANSAWRNQLIDRQANLRQGSTPDMSGMPEYMRNQYSQASSGSEGGEGSQVWNMPGTSMMDSQGREVFMLNDDGSPVDGSNRQLNEGFNRDMMRYDPDLGWVTDIANTNQSAWEANRDRGRIMAAAIIATMGAAGALAPAAAATEGAAGGAYGGMTGTSGGAFAGWTPEAAGAVGSGAGAGTGAGAGSFINAPGTYGVGSLPTAGAPLTTGSGLGLNVGTGLGTGLDLGGTITGVGGLPTAAGGAGAAGLIPAAGSIATPVAGAPGGINPGGGSMPTNSNYTDLIRAGMNLLGNRNQGSMNEAGERERQYNEMMWTRALQANRPNQYTPFGSSEWTQDPTTGAWTQRTSLNPQDQQRLDQFRGIASGRMNDASQMLQLDWSKINPQVAQMMQGVSFGGNQLRPRGG